MKAQIGFSPSCSNATPSGSLSPTFLARKNLRHIAAVLIVGLVLFLLFSAPSIQAAPTFYIPHQFSHTLSVIDATNYVLKKTIPVDCTTGGIAITPDKKKVLVAIIDRGDVTILGTGAVTGTYTIHVGGRPYSVAVSPDGRFAYVSVQREGGRDNGYVSVIDISTYKVVATVGVGRGPQGVAVHPNSSKVYVSNYSDRSVSVINSLTRTVTKTITVGGGPRGIATHPSGSHVFVVNQFDHTLTVISTSSDSVTKTVGIGKNPSAVAVDPLGRFIYASNWGESTLSVLDTSSNSVIKTISLVPGSGAGGISLNKAGTRAYVVNTGRNVISVIDTTTHSVLAEVATSTQPIAFGGFLLDDSFYPEGLGVYSNPAEYFPVIAKEPSETNPLGVGPVAYRFNRLKLRVGFDEFPAPVDVYLALHVPALGSDMILLTPGPGMQLASEGIVPWKSATKGPIDEILFGEIPTSLLPPVTFTLYVLVTPAGSLNSAFLWSTSFFGQYKIMDVAQALVDSLGGEPGFDAVVLAMDKGYSVRQIADAATSRRLLSSGDISDGSGGAEPPANAPYGIIRRPVRAGEHVTLDELRTTIKRDILDSGIVSATPAAEESILRKALLNCVFMGLAHSGYSFDEAVEGIRNGLLALVMNDGQLIVTLVKIDGTPVAPAGPFGRPGVFSDPVPLDPCGPDGDKDKDDYWPNPDCPQSNKWGSDCNDTPGYGRDINPGMLEICGDGKDNDCDESTKENDTCCSDPLPKQCGAVCIGAGDECCEDGDGYCVAGFYCLSGGCCPDYASEPCGRGCMPPGNVCCGASGRSCEPGWKCEGEDKCVRSEASRSARTYRGDLELPYEQ